MCSAISTKFKSLSSNLPVIASSKVLFMFLVPLNYPWVGHVWGGGVERPVMGFGQWLGG